MLGSHRHVNGGREVEVVPVRPSDLRPGMVVLGWTMPSNIRPTSWDSRTPSCIADPSGPFTVSRSGDGRSVHAWCRTGPEILLTMTTETCWMFVWKPSLAPQGGIPEFPHRCPQCGQAAYIGVFKVEHQEPGRCPNG